MPRGWSASQRVVDADPRPGSPMSREGSVEMCGLAAEVVAAEQGKPDQPAQGEQRPARPEHRPDADRVDLDGAEPEREQGRKAAPPPTPRAR